MRVRSTVLSRIEAFCTQHGVGVGEFGRLAVGNRDFIADLRAQKPVTLGRVEKAEAFMERVTADPDCLAALRKEASQTPQPRGRGGASLAAGEGSQEAGEAEGNGASAHKTSVRRSRRNRHREPFSREAAS